VKSVDAVNRLPASKAWRRTHLLCAWAAVTLGVLLVGVDAMAASHAVQLRLDRAGVPLQGPVDLALATYAAPLGGVALAESLLPATNFDGGLASVDYASPLTAVDGNSAWIEVRVTDPASGNVIALAPRIALTAVPLAVVAAQATAGSIDAVAIDPDQVQRRGTVACSGSTPRVANVDRDGGPSACAGDLGIEAVAGGLGIRVLPDTAGQVVGLDFGSAQRRRTPHCEPGFAMRAMPIVGVPTCVPDVAPLQTVVRIETSCAVPGGVNGAGCGTTVRCPAQQPRVIGGGQIASCAALRVTASYPLSDELGTGWVVGMAISPDDFCPAASTVSAYAYCAAGL
jgi:hypothetical protein